MTPRPFLTIAIAHGPTATVRIVGDRWIYTRSDTCRTVTAPPAEVWQLLHDFVTESQKGSNTP